MNIERASKVPVGINGTIINVSFPRSGHRFLREILSGYFEQGFVFYESYTKNILSQDDSLVELKYVNFVKTHDFHHSGRKVLLLKFPRSRRYLIQIRHPLESIASYYEFALRQGRVRNDTEANWNSFLTKNLKNWKRFCETWLNEKRSDCLLVCYHRLYSETFETSQSVIRFLTGQDSINVQHLHKVLEEQEFLQYVGDCSSKRQNKRRLETFKYFDANEFRKIETGLLKNYLEPNGINVLLQQ